MVFNIYGDRNYNDNEIYNGIMSDSELNNFFASFTLNYNKMCETIKSEKIKN